MEDIDDPSYLSLEERRRKMTEERTSKAIERKKLAIQRRLASLKKEFKMVQQSNTDLPREYRQDRRNFQITDFTFAKIGREVDEKLETVLSEMEAETGESVAALDKIKHRFFDDILSPLRTVRGLRCKDLLSSFRIGRHQAININVYIQDELGHKPPKRGEEDENQAEEDSDDDNDDVPNEASDGDGDDEGDENSDDLKRGQGTRSPGVSSSMTSHSRSRLFDLNSLDPKVVKSLKKQEERKENRLNRKREWDELNARRPKEGEEDPELVEEIRLATERIGNFTRKTSYDYEDKNPGHFEDMRKNVISLILKIKEKKEKFNEIVLGMKSRKSELLRELENISKNLIIIQQHLDATTRKPIPAVPVLVPEEIEKDPLEIDDEDVEQIKVKLLQEDESGEFGMAGDRRSVGSRRSSINSYRHSSGKGSRPISRQSSISGHKKSRTEAGGGGGGTTGEMILDEDAEEDIFKPEEIVVSPVEAEQTRIINVKYQHEQNLYIDEMESLMSQFDQDLKDIIWDKENLAVKLKYAELRCIFLYEEMQLTRRTEKKEDSFIWKVDDTKIALDATRHQVQSKEKRYEKKMNLLNHQRDQLRVIEEMVSMELSDNKHSEFLRSFYEIRDHQRKNQLEDRLKDETFCPNDDEIFEESLDFLKFLREYSDEELRVPEDVDPVTIKFITEQRSKRDKLESNMNDLESGVEKIERSLQVLRHHERSQKKKYESALAKLHNFRNEKQAKLNELDVVTVLKKEQLVYLSKSQIFNSELVDATMTQNLSDDALLIFYEKDLKQLEKRTDELRSERAMQKKKHKEDRQAYLNLLASCKETKEEIARLNVQCSSEMIRRFGDGVKLENIESLGVNRTLEEVKESSKRSEERKYKTIERKDVHIRKEQMKLKHTIMQNSRMLERKTAVMQEHRLVESLLKTNQALIKKYLESKEREEASIRELNELANLYRAQEREIYEIRNKLTRFMTKGAPLIVNEKRNSVRKVYKPERQAEEHYEKSKQQQQSYAGTMTMITTSAVENGGAAVVIVVPADATTTTTSSSDPNTTTVVAVDVVHVVDSSSSSDPIQVEEEPKSLPKE